VRDTDRGKQVGFQYPRHRAPILLGKQAKGVDSGIVDENIDAKCPCGIRNAFDAFGLIQVGNHGFHLTAGTRHAGEYGLQPGGVAARQQNVGAFLDKRTGQSTAQPAAGASEKNACMIQFHTTPSSSVTDSARKISP
jgi:hypothetical protein